MEPAINQLNLFSQILCPRPVKPLPVPTARAISFRSKYRKAYYLRHPEKLKEERKRRYLKYRERELARRQEHRKKARLKNPELERKKARDQYRSYFDRNVDKVRAYKRRYSKERRPFVKAWKIKIRDEFLKEYGGKCTCCGIAERSFLTLEHINHDGKKHRKDTWGNSTTLLLDLKKRGWPKDGFTIFCWNCNMATRFGQACPHKEEK